GNQVKVPTFLVPATQTVELQTVDGLVKDSTQCAPNGYYFIPVYDKGSFTLKINGPEGWSWSPDKVPVVVDDSSCNNNEDINFRFTGFTLSGKVLGAVGGESCMIKNGGPADVNVELLSSDGDPIASVLTTSDGSYLFKNIIPGKYSIRASHPELQVEVRGSTEVELGFANGLVDDIFFVLGYDLKGSVVAQGNPILGVHIYLHSDDVSMVDCPQGLGDASGERKPLCHAVSDADGIFSFKSIPCATAAFYFRGNAEKKMLFYPKELRAVVSNDGCQAAVSAFTGRLGLYIQGSVSPPLPGVNIKVSAAKDSLISSLKKGEVAVETSTSPDGSFVAGPLYDDIPYDTDASKPGYHIKRLGPYSFSCQKLGQISVRVSSKDNAETSVPPLLLSLSGDHGYRNNSISGAGGLFVFDSLFPGNFYLRPLLKEYSFKPSTLAIELGSGESSEAVFEATRVAYSAMGRVALLTGQPQEGVAIEARSDSKGYYEETTSDIDGNYRLRGLHPGATYVIKVSKRNGPGKNNIERASPESVSLQIGYEDIHGLDFLVFEQPETTILTCHVEGKQLKDIYQSTVGFSAPGFTASSTKREPRKAVARKKTF
ncbi:hypothetical protein DY000_02056889, partial [Brassica cretica]